MALLTRPHRTRTAGVLLGVLLGATLGLPAAAAAPPALGLEQRLTAADAGKDVAIFGGFGREVAMDGDRLVVKGSGFQSGLELFVRTGAGGSWTWARSLPTPGGLSSLDLDGTTLAVGMAGSGVHVHDLANPAAPPVVLSDSTTPQFGTSVAVDGDRLVVGSDAGGAQQDQRRAVVYERTGGTWTVPPGGRLAPGQATAGWFGRTVDVDGDLVVVPDADNVFVYRRGPAGWAREAVIPAPAGEQVDIESGALVVDDTVLVAVNPPNSGVGSNRVFALRRSGSSWQVQQTITVPGDLEEVAVDGTRLAVLDAAGTVHHYALEGSSWTAGPPAPAPTGDGATNGRSRSLDVSGTRVVVGAPEARAGDLFDAGAVYVFTSGAAVAREPGAPTAVEGRPGAAAGSAVVTWRAPTDAGTAPLLRYVVTAVPEGAAAESGRVVVGATATEVTLTGLTALASYRFRVVAESSAGPGPASAPSAAVVVPGASAVASPYLLRDPAGDAADPRTDILDVRLTYAGSDVTVAIRTAQVVDPLTDPLFLASGRGAYIYVRFAPPARGDTMIIQHQSTNGSPFNLPGEQFIARFEFDDVCSRQVFPVRVADGAYTVTFPSACMGSPSLLIAGVRLVNPDDDTASDETALSPPIQPSGGPDVSTPVQPGGGAVPSPPVQPGGGSGATPASPRRLSGADRYATAAAVADAWPTVAQTVYVATGTGFADALAGGPAAARDGGGPLLLVSRTSVPDSTLQALRRLRPARIVVLGGPAAVADAVLAELGPLASGVVSRLAGPDRYATAAAVSRATAGPGGAVVIASGEDYPDALAAAAVAGNRRAPVLLARRDGLPEATRAELVRLAPTEIVVVGGSRAVSDATVAAMAPYSSRPVVRVAGADRVATAVALSASAFAGAEQVYVATSTDFADALAAGALAGRRSAPVLLVPSSGSVPSAVLAEIRRLRPREVVAVGGPSRITDAVLARLAAATG